MKTLKFQLGPDEDFFDGPGFASLCRSGVLAIFPQLDEATTLTINIDRNPPPGLV